MILFCVIDFLAVLLAFELSFQSGRLYERIELTPNALHIERVTPHGEIRRWSSQPFWTQVTFDRPVGHESHVRVMSKGDAIIVGEFMAPDERARFADVFSDALARIRGGVR